MIALLLVAPAAARAAPAPFFDSRVAALQAGTAVPRDHPHGPRQRSALRDLRARLGGEAVVDLDRVTGTVRHLERLDGTLSAPAAHAPATVATRWIREHRTALGLTPAGLAGLRAPARSTTPSTGVTHLRYRQAYEGVPAFDSGVDVNVDREGRILTVTGSPLRDPAVPAIVPSIGPAAAVHAAQRRTGGIRALGTASGPTGPRRETTFSGGAWARLVLFATATGPTLAWHVLDPAPAAYYDAVVDAATGALLYRQSLTKSEAPATVYPNYPGAERDPAAGGTWTKAAANAPLSVDLESAGWLPAGADTLVGRYVHTYADIDRSGDATAGEEIAREAGGFDFPLATFNDDIASDPAMDGACDFTGPPADDQLAPLGTTIACTWNPAAPRSWRVNRAQDGVQAFYLANVFADHLASAPIGFTAANDGFGGTGTGDQADPVLEETDVGVDYAGDGVPDYPYLNNASMSTLPDGQSPEMQLYLYRYEPDDVYRFRDMNGGDDAGTVWHEYTHGLSGRLIVNDDGTSAVSSAHAGAMGEAWSDWYALDLLHRPDGPNGTPLELDDPATPGEVDIGTSTDAVFASTRYEPIDCPVGSTAPRCPGSPEAGPGGFTFGDFGTVNGAPEVHSDGEIWMQTLWDLRTDLIAESDEATGSDRAEQLVTEAMRLSPPEPSFLDERDAILAADQATGGHERDLIWRVFAHRGMGWSASVDGPEDVTPQEAFDLPPAPAPAPAETPAPAPAGGTPGPVVTPAPAPAARAPAIRQLRARWRHGRVRIAVACTTRCRLTAWLTLTRDSARRLGVHPRRMRRVDRSLHTTHARTLTLKVPARVRRAARRHHAVHVRARLTVRAHVPGLPMKHRARTVRIRL